MRSGSLPGGRVAAYLKRVALLAAVLALSLAATTPAQGAVAVMIVSKQSGKCLDVAGYGTHDGANVWLWTCHGGSNQRWIFGKVYGDPPFYWIKNVHSNKCLTVSGGGLANGTDIVISTCAGAAHQKWWLGYTSAPSYYHHQPKHANHASCMDVAWGDTFDGADVWQWSCHWPYAPNQEWMTVV
ncbi:RICIN domain-containing protein [Spongiactinospora sp. TRM90649]|uniref:RICIN domain-containing protein n=1 Tax=Spongiactinospora sp. TRM90649 TaxID=3031114 RepID=UPI0023F8193A|nr:RICIN domain-containing protein [Spongiactinospora sp. TRM90649]MDF5754700.1 RICIN domain-containing protein [Spongiactinospora sp. TRM90649]